MDPDVKLLGSEDGAELFPHLTCVSDAPRTPSNFDIHRMITAVCRALLGKLTSADMPLVIVRGAKEWSGFRPNTVFLLGRPMNEQDQTLCRSARCIGAGSILRRYGCDCAVYVDDYNHSSVIASESLYRELTMLVHATPWLRHQQPTQLEKNIMGALLRKGEAPVAELAAWCREHRVAETLNVKKMQTFTKGLLERRSKVYQKEADELNRRIAQAEADIRAWRSDLRKMNYVLLGIQASDDTDAAETFVQAITTNPNIKVVSVGDMTIQIAVAADVTNFNRQSYVAVTNELGSVLYRFEDCRAAQLLMKKLLDAMFIGDRYRLRCSGLIKIDLDAGNVTLIKTSQGLHENAMPNPHIAEFGCVGGFGRMYRDAMDSGEYLDVLDIAFSEVGNINWADYTVLNRFAYNLRDKYWSLECIWDREEKQFISPKELMERIKREETHE